MPAQRVRGGGLSWPCEDASAGGVYDRVTGAWLRVGLKVPRMGGEADDRAGGRGSSPGLGEEFGAARSSGVRIGGRLRRIVLTVACMVALGLLPLAPSTFGLALESRASVDGPSRVWPSESLTVRARGLPAGDTVSVYLQEIEQANENVDTPPDGDGTARVRRSGEVRLLFRWPRRYFVCRGTAGRPPPADCIAPWQLDHRAIIGICYGVRCIHTTVLVVAAPRPSPRYVALGDSYSSGEGAIDSRGHANFDAATTKNKRDECHRSHNAYPWVVSKSPAAAHASFTFRACSGALIADVVAKLGNSGGWNEGPQLDAIAPSDRPDPNIKRVTLSIGGNDAGFPAVLKKCVHGFRWPFNNGASDKDCIRFAEGKLAQGVALIRHGGTILVDTKDGSWAFCRGKVVCNKPRAGQAKQRVAVPSLAGLFQEIRRRAPQAAIRVLLYPHLFGSAPPARCNLGTFPSAIQHTYTVSGVVASKLNKLGDELDSAIATQIAAAAARHINIATGDGRPALAQHGLCDTASPWINGLLWDGHFLTDISPFSFHPTALGQAALAATMER